MLLNFLAGFVSGVLCAFGTLGLLTALVVAWAKDSAERWLKGIA